MTPLQLNDLRSMDKERRHRKQIRLQHYDYRQNGHYFVTLCTLNRRSLFASDKAETLVLSKLNQIPRFFPGVSVDYAVVMPDHLHAILVFEKSEKSLGQVVQIFKSWVTHALSPGGPIWQRGFYDHVIRSEAALHRIREYIQNNPIAEKIEWEQFYKV